jgi:hypothetical protein
MAYRLVYAEPQVEQNEWRLRSAPISRQRSPKRCLGVDGGRVTRPQGPHARRVSTLRAQSMPHAQPPYAAVVRVDEGVDDARVELEDAGLLFS